jgi:hypothetical protein
MHNYDVQYELHGETEWEGIEAADPGNAFAKAQMMFPGAKILKALRSVRYLNSPWSAWTEYEPPPVRREIKPQPRTLSPKKAEANTATFPFYDQVKK